VNPVPVPATVRSRRRRLSTSVVFLRQVPGTSPIHRLWAGTKLLVVAALSLTLSLAPSWSSVGAAFGLLVVAGVVGRIPLGALPRFPKVFWAFLVFGAALSVLSGRAPTAKVAGIVISLHSLDLYARFTAVSFLLLGASMMVGWTTPLGEVAPALARLGRPLRWLRVPVDEWALTVSLCVRTLPLMIDELRTLVAARRIRPRPRIEGPGSGSRLVDELIDFVTAGLAVAMRRAGELGEAMTARGGVTTVMSRRPGPGRSDLVAMVSTAALCAGAAIVYALH